MLLEFGPTYELTQSLVTSKLNNDGTALQDQSDPTLPAGTRFVVFDWNEWEPYSKELKNIGKNPNFYAIKLEAEVHGSSKYLALAHRLERDSKLIQKPE